MALFCILIGIAIGYFICLQNPTLHKTLWQCISRPFLTILFILAVLALSGCGEKPKSSWGEIEAARQQAIENSEFNAKSFRNAYDPNMTIMSRGDSSISPSCPQGDGWATVDLVPADGTQGKKQVIKCSTVSHVIGSQGCMTEDDFKKRADYANQDGHCNPDIPYPLPKLLK